MSDPIRLIAFYLPQFYPIQENDQWWGRGFTEWTNVVKARPQFRGHYQPHLPADMGFYDLRCAETRQDQVDLAREHGVSGFCYYHCWFSGRRMLERPYDEMVKSGQPDFPFCLYWSNHNWTRVWDGGHNQMLIEQTYSHEDDIIHMEAMAPWMSDKRYIRIDGRPIFLVHRACDMPDPRRSTDTWRERAQKLGLGDILLIRAENAHGDFIDPATQGFDVAMEFHPRTGSLGLPMHHRPWRYRHGLGAVLANLRHGHKIYDYETVSRLAMKLPDVPYVRIPSVMVCWDNTARRIRNAVIVADSNPELYEKWLNHAIAKSQTLPRAKGVVFINAWNEWAEGNHLEPDQRDGLGYLQATRRALSAASARSQNEPLTIPSLTPSI